MLYIKRCSTQVFTKDKVPGFHSAVEPENYEPFKKKIVTFILQHDLTSVLFRFRDDRFNLFHYLQNKNFTAEVSVQGNKNISREVFVCSQTIHFFYIVQCERNETFYNEIPKNFQNNFRYLFKKSKTQITFSEVLVANILFL